MNKNNITKIICMLIVFTFVLPNIVFADLQGPVTDLDIINRSSNNGKDYSIELDWTRPYPSGKADSEANAVDQSTSHRPTSYSLYYRNGTKNEAYGSDKKADIADPSGDKLDITTNSNLSYLFKPSFLEAGSVYSFYVDPTHEHLYDVIVNETATTVTRDANKTDDDIQEVLFLTDIQVEAEINGSRMTVTWDNPTYMGREIFSGYKIYYQKGGSQLAEIPENPSVVVSSNNSGLSSANGKLTYTFSADNLEIGALYAVKVEPMFDGEVIRELVNPRIIINNKSHKIAFTSREYRTDDVYVSPALHIMQEGLEYIRLYWDSLASSSYDITKLEIYSSKSETFDQSVLIGSLEGESAERINYWLSVIPDSLTYYKFVLYYKDGSKENIMESNSVYFDPSIFEFTPYTPHILEVNASESEPINMQVLWEAFMRNAYTEEEKNNINAIVNKYVDKNLEYKIWVTDDISNYSEPIFNDSYIKSIDGADLQEKQYIIDKATNEKTLVYEDAFTTYYEYNDGVSTAKPLQSNKIYYIKIQAERHITGELSKESYYAIYIPPIGPVITNPLAINKPPFKIKTDTNGVEEITENTITVEWSTEWFEIFDEKTNDWYSKVGIDANGNLVFGDDTKSLSNDKVLNLDNKSLFGGDISETTSKVRDTLISMGLSEEKANLLAIRHMNIENSNYELHTTTYSHMNDLGGYSAYFDSIKDNNALWESVTGERGDDSRKLYHVVTNSNSPATEELQPNTSYVMYFRNYIMKDGQKIYSVHPIYATGTTLKDMTDLIVTPPAQKVEYVSSTYNTVTFRWEYSSEISYEFKYSNQLAHYSEDGISVINEEIQKQKDIRTIDDKTYVYYTVQNLFPDTTYYAWVKATIGEKSSDWSTPESGATDELSLPLKPRGLGVISTEFLKAINAENGVDYVKDDPNYLIFEWSRITEDKADYGVAGITAVENDEYLGARAYTRSYGAKFNDLKANTKYYFRARTILNGVREDMGGSYYYSYEVELADNPTFKDSTTFLVPNHGLEVDGVDILEVKSEWTSILSFVSGKTGDEYDGEIDPDQYPMPLDDFDITYDEETGVLTYEFRSTGIDSNGNENHFVDQRFISNLQQKGYFDFVVDVTDYNGIYPQKRVVEVPSTIMNAFKDTKTSLTMKADNMQLTILPNTFHSENMLLNNKANVTFQFNLDTKNYLLNNGESFLSVPHNFEVVISTEDNFKKVDMFNNDVEVSLIAINQYEEIDKNVNMYELQGDNWEMKQSTKNDNGKYTLTTKMPNTYSLIAKEVPTSQAIDDSLHNVNKHLLITDMDYYMPQYDTTTTQFNNIVYAVATGQNEVKMNETLSQTAYNHLGKSGLLVPGSYVTYEEGINSLVRLYELKTGSRITPTTETVSNIQTASSEYVQSIKKAYEVEMFDNVQNFKNNMTFSDFIYYLELILID